MIVEVGEADFQERVLERSRTTPVVVDFWAEWCAPCRALGPLLERAASAREGKVDLAKVDTEANPRLAQAFGIRGIPAVKAFRDGRIADEFVGLLPADAVERFFDRLVPSEADELAGVEDEAALRRALELEPGHAGAAAKLARVLLRRGEAGEARSVLEGVPGDFLALGLLARIELAEGSSELDDAFAAWDDGDHERALARLEEALTGAEPDRRDLIRQAMVGVFEEVGQASELAQRFRRRLSAALY